MENQRDNKILSLFISFLVAIFLWGYVSSDSDKMSYGRITDIPILINNSAVLEQNDYMVILEKEKLDSVRVYGKTSIVRGLDNENVQASVSLEGITETGEYSLSVNIKGLPSDVSIVDQTPAKIKVTVDRKESKFVSKPDIKTTEKTKNGYAVTGLNTNIDGINITGPSIKVNKLDSIIGVVNVEDKLESCTEEVTLMAVDANNNEIKEVSISPSKVKVDVRIGQVKEVKVSPKYSGEVASGYILTGVTLKPKTVEIAGTADILDKITSVNTHNIYIGGKSVSYEEEISLDLPNGVVIVDNDNRVKVYVKIDKDKTKTIEISSFTFDNLRSDLDAKVLDKGISVIIEGKNSILKKVTGENIQGTLNMDGLDKGTHNVDITISTKGLPAGVKIKSVNKNSVKVKVE